MIAIVEHLCTFQWPFMYRNRLPLRPNHRYLHRNCREPYEHAYCSP